MDQGGRGTAQVEQSPRNSCLKRGGKFLAQRTQFKLCKNQRFDLPGPKTRFFSTRCPQKRHVVQSAQTRTRPLAIDMHVGGRANTRSRDPGRTKLYCQSNDELNINPPTPCQIGVTSQGIGMTQEQGVMSSWRHQALFPASEAEGNIVSITRRGRHRPRAPLAFRFFGVMSLFDTTSYHTPETETATDSKESGMPCLGSPRKASH